MNIEKSYNDFKNEKTSREDLKRDVIHYAYEKAEYNRYIESGDFIVEFIPKVSSIIDKYDPALSSFPHYLNKNIKWIMCLFSRNYIQKKEKSEAWEAHNVAEYKNGLFISEETSNYKICNKAKEILSINHGRVKRESSRKRLEIFILKNIRLLTDEQIEILAPAIDRTTEWLYSVREEIENLCEKRVKNREYLKERYNRLYIEIIRLQKKLILLDDGEEKEILFSRLENKQRIKEDLAEKIQSRHCGPKNEEIANILNIPKGTVDSSLFYLKKDLESLLPDLNII